MTAFFYTQPWSQTPFTFRSRQGMICTLLSKTASSSMNSIGISGGSGIMTLLTRKCLRLLMGLTAVHLVRSSFFGLSEFWFLEGIALKFIGITNQLTRAGYKAFTRALDLSWALDIKIAHRPQATAVIKLTILKLHLSFFENHRVLDSSAIDAWPGGIGFPLAG